jgi:hypothetical protein
MFPIFLPYLLGFAPILLARRWPARVVAILFGLFSVGFYCYFASSLPAILHALSPLHGSHLSYWQRIVLSPFTPLSIALVSAVVTYLVDKKPTTKVESAKTSGMSRSRARLYLGGLLLIPVLSAFWQLSVWSSIEREVHWYLISGALAAFPVVILFPVLIRGSSWERILAVLLLLLPVLVLVSAFLTAMSYL